MTIRIRVKGKTVKIRHIPAVAVIGDQYCTMPLFAKGEGAVKGMIRKSESLP